MAKIHCPVHNDTTPSMEVYEDRGFCFVCSASIPIEELDVEYVKKPPTDISKTIEYIKSLPIKSIRGLDLPYDESGYYIKWPDDSFYKKRFWQGKVRYSGPRGQKPTLFKYAPQANTTTLCLIEGELNAKTFHDCIDKSEYSGAIASFGAASNAESYINEYLQYNTIYAIFDKDGPGLAHGLKLHYTLLAKKKRIEIILMETDYNDLLVLNGVDSVREEAKRIKALGM